MPKGWIEPWVIERNRGQREPSEEFSCVEQVALKRLPEKCAVADFAGQDAEEHVRLNTHEAIMPVAIDRPMAVRGFVKLSASRIACMKGCAGRCAGPKPSLSGTPKRMFSPIVAWAL